MIGFNKSQLYFCDLPLAVWKLRRLFAALHKCITSDRLINIYINSNKEPFEGVYSSTFYSTYLIAVLTTILIKIWQAFHSVLKQSKNS